MTTKILSIADVLPITKLKAENDAILRLYNEIMLQRSDIEILIYKPLSYPFPMRSLFDNTWRNYIELHKAKSYYYNNFEINILPGIMFRSPVWMQRYLNSTFFSFNRKRLLNIISRNKISMIHANYLHFDGLIALKLHKSCGIPFSVTSREVDNVLKHPFFENKIKEVLINANSVFAFNMDRYSFLKPICGDKVCLVPHGIEKDFIVEKSHRIAGENRLLSVCRLLKLKNVDKILISLSKLKNKYTFKYTLIGEGPEREHLLHIIKSLGLCDYVHYIDRVPYEDMPNVYAEHDVFLLCSYPETFGRVYFEAMAAGLPILCANRLAINGFFDEGVSGFSVNPDDNEGILAKIEFFLSHPKLTAEMGDKARDQARQFLWPCVAKSYISSWGFNKIQ